MPKNKPCGNKGDRPSRRRRLGVGPAASVQQDSRGRHPVRSQDGRQKAQLDGGATWHVARIASHVGQKDGMIYMDIIYIYTRRRQSF